MSSPFRAGDTVYKLVSILTTASISEVSAGANIDCTINLCLLFSLGS
uniref:Uncharacterized protein n=1 Tax=Chelydra serpentina TaxID=8475 RepID=A0A8C3RNG1_CHESE